jgi:hypothetical protein
MGSSGRGRLTAPYCTLAKGEVKLVVLATIACVCRGGWPRSEGLDSGKVDGPGWAVAGLESNRYRGLGKRAQGGEMWDAPGRNEPVSAASQDSGPLGATKFSVSPIDKGQNKGSSKGRTLAMCTAGGVPFNCPLESKFRFLVTVTFVIDRPALSRSH